MFLIIATTILALIAWVCYYRSKKADQYAQFFDEAKRDYLHITKYDDYKG